MSSDNTETVTTFTLDGDTYEIDHLGICDPDNFGSFAVYRDGRMVGNFHHHAPWVSPRDIPLPDEIDLVSMAKAALA